MKKIIFVYVPIISPKYIIEDKIYELKKHEKDKRRKWELKNFEKKIKTMIENDDESQLIKVNELFYFENNSKVRVLFEYVKLMFYYPIIGIR